MSADLTCAASCPVRLAGKVWESGQHTFELLARDRLACSLLGVRHGDSGSGRLVPPDMLPDRVSVRCGERKVGWESKGGQWADPYFDRPPATN